MIVAVMTVAVMLVVHCGNGCNGWNGCSSLMAVAADNSCRRPHFKVITLVTKPGCISVADLCIARKRSQEMSSFPDLD